MVVISDKRITLCTSSVVSGYEADVVSASDYYPFGMLMRERTYSSASYRFGFNGKENDDETKTQDYGMRIYNSALGRFLSVDPMTKGYPMLTPFQFGSNCPILNIDLDGCEGVSYNERQCDGVTVQVDVSVVNGAPSSNTTVQNNTIPAAIPATATTPAVPTPMLLAPSGGGSGVNTVGRTAALPILPGTPAPVPATAPIAAANSDVPAALATMQPAAAASLNTLTTTNPPPGTTNRASIGVPNQFNQSVISSPVPGAGALPAVPVQMTASINNLIAATPSPGSIGTGVIANNTSRILIITNGNVATNNNVIVQVTALQAANPNIQFSVGVDATRGLANNQVVLYQNPTQDAITPGNPNNTTGLNVTAWPLPIAPARPLIPTSPAVLLPN